MKLNKDTLFLLLIIAFISIGAITSNLLIIFDKNSKQETDFKAYKAQFIGTDITTNIYAYKNDQYSTGDTVLVSYWQEEQCLIVDYQETEKSFKIVIK